MRRKDDKLQILSKELVTFLVAMRLGVTPVPIPNTMVKTQAADGTALETVWESRWLPEFEKKEQMRNRRKCSGDSNRYRHG